MFDAVIRWFSNTKRAKDIAKSRIQLMLAYERTEISPEIMDSLREEIFEVISKYFVIKEDSVEMNLSRSDESVALMANIPILKMKRQVISAKQGEITNESQDMNC